MARIRPEDANAGTGFGWLFRLATREQVNTLRGQDRPRDCAAEGGGTRYHAGLSALVGPCKSVQLSLMAGERSASLRLRTPRAGMGARSIQARGARVRMGLMPLEPRAEHGDTARSPSPPSRSPAANAGAPESSSAIPRRWGPRKKRINASPQTALQAPEVAARWQAKCLPGRACTPLHYEFSSCEQA